MKPYLAISTLAFLSLTACAPTGTETDPESTTSSAAAVDPLPSWNEGATRTAILSFVERTTTAGSPDFVPPAERIAVFDNDGTLWSEQPLYFQFLFALDRVKAVAADHPEWKETEPFRAVLEDDREALAGMGMHEIVEIVMATHSGLTTDEFAQVVEEWMATARHPRFGVPYTDLVYQPMLELLSYLRESGFKTFIVSGGGIDFMRVFTERVYGIPPEQVVGSSGNLEFAMVDGVPTLTKTAGLDFIDDKAGKPVGIWRFIGRRPILAGGNSDGDLQMLQYTAPGDRTAFGLIVHHDDDEREVAYDRDSHVGRLDVALTEAPERGWVVVSMKNDWSKVFPSPELP
ncbi:MAG: haloacid dehalogenase-like hydrolase [Gemmatimonadetes bacterium]|nr:haloacid dehalogenase-like hydrolase [Gemmatimonadota bacterium]NNK47483.1 haloacid dehalogenase-like hydrolase [Gemmatimonadota bacterium]